MSILNEFYKRAQGTMIHVTPQGMVQSIMNQGLTAPAYMHADYDTAEDALVNWMVDKFPDEQYFTFIEVNTEGLELNQDRDGFMMGSVYTDQDIPPQNLRILTTLDVGQE